MTDAQERLGKALAGRYDLERELGRGGMATVYLARDLKHRRQVALKALHPEVTHSVGAERFLREVATVAGLAHPHILPLFDSGDADGQLWFTMPYVEGGSLRSRLTRDGPLPVDTAVRVAAQVADALATAHKQGIIHRDIKPENILLSGDHALLTDFGIAKIVTPVTDESLTSAGVAVGTPCYMSPEQATADQELDARTDVYSLGCVLYEMLAGTPPHTGLTFQAILVKVFTEPVSELRTISATIPAWIDYVVHTALARDPAARFPTAAEFALALTAPQPSVLVPPATPSVSTRHRTVGRETELAQLREALARVTAGVGLMLSVSGEPGIGKTALVEDFLDDLPPVECLVGRGRCSERLAGTEAYLPILEALASLLEAPARDEVGQTLTQLAPNWRSQVVSKDSGAVAPTSDQAVSQERLKRELLRFLQELTRTRPLILFLDDVHWADASTVDLLAYLGSRLDTMRLLILATFRPAELSIARHPFRALKMHLESHRLSEELALSFLTPEVVERYLITQFPDHAFPPALTRLILLKTEGNPLFVVEMMRQLRNRGAIAQVAGRWSLVGSLDELSGDIPTSLQSLIVRMMDQLEEDDRRLLVDRL